MTATAHPAAHATEGQTPTVAQRLAFVRCGHECGGGRGAGGLPVADHGFQHPEHADEAEQDQGVKGVLGALPRAIPGAQTQLRRQGGEGVGQGGGDGVHVS